MTNEKKPDINMDDLEAAVGALDSYLDAFGEEPDRAEEMVRVRRAMDAFSQIVEDNRVDVSDGRWPMLRLVKGKPEEDEQ